MAVITCLSPIVGKISFLLSVEHTMADLPEFIQDRRSIERIVLEAPWFADATIGDRCCKVAIIDFSNSGAKIQTVQGDATGPFVRGERCELLVHLPSGEKIVVTATLSWSFRLPEGALLGVHFHDHVDARLLREVYECDLEKHKQEPVRPN